MTAKIHHKYKFIVQGTKYSIYKFEGLKDKYTPISKTKTVIKSIYYDIRQ